MSDPEEAALVAARYELHVLSEDNMERHGRRMADVFFRLITF